MALDQVSMGNDQVLKFVFPPKTFLLRVQCVLVHCLGEG